MNSINLSFFDIFKIGPGPSSSHTIGPMNAARNFVLNCEKLPESTLRIVASVKVKLFGSLSSTGIGHGTDRAIVAGLLGYHPESCSPDILEELLPTPDGYRIRLGINTVILHDGDIVFDKVTRRLKYQNTMIFELHDAAGGVTFSRTFYSVGGGLIRCQEEPPVPCAKPVYRYSNMCEFKKLVEENGKSPIDILLENEAAITGFDKNKINEKLDLIVTAMETAVDNGLHSNGLLPGPIQLERKATDFLCRANETAEPLDRYLLLINAYAFAAAEENAAGNIVVTAPTSGASGIVPAVTYFLKLLAWKDAKTIREGMMLAALIAFVATNKASISGAEVGCQGEIGVAASMAAAMLAHVNGHGIKIVENAAEIALEHHLGMTCDPVCGYVQIPCIERNAVGAVTAYNAYLLAVGGNAGKQKVSFDEVVDAMRETGRDMQTKYKETSRGGLATSIRGPQI